MTLSSSLTVYAPGPFGLFGEERFRLQFHIIDEDLPAVKQVIEEHCSSFEWIGLKSPAGGGPEEMSFSVTLKQTMVRSHFLAALRRFNTDTGLQLSHNEFRA
jgi:hypothetical protein